MMAVFASSTAALMNKEEIQKYDECAADENDPLLSPITVESKHAHFGASPMKYTSERKHYNRTSSNDSLSTFNSNAIPTGIDCSSNQAGCKVPSVPSQLSLQENNEDDDDDNESGLFIKIKKEQQQLSLLSAKTTSTAATTTTASRRKQLWPRLELSAMQFGLRMAILLTISGLFVLVHTSQNWHYPDGMWVLVSVLFVCWFPSLDAASVIEKIYQRLIGTFLGAFLGLGCGFLSLWVYTLHKNDLYQAIFLCVCMFIFNFGIVFLAGQCKVGGVKVIVRFSYATILCVLTFCICMLPFALSEEPKWYKGCVRVVNVIVGCILGAAGSIAICPKSTTDVLYEKTARQVRLAGEASEALLQTAADHFAGLIPVSRLADEILRQPLESSMRWKFRRSNSGLSDDSAYMRIDIALKKYEDAIMDWRATKALFPLAQYDPFHLNWLNANEDFNKSKMIQTEMARTLARALRIQTTIVVLDGMVRNDADYEFSREHLHLFAEVGSLIKTMLIVPLELQKTNEAAKQLFRKLEIVRKNIIRMSSHVADVIEESNTIREKCVSDFQLNLLIDVRDDSPGHSGFGTHHNMDEDENGRGIPKDATGRHENTLFFLQLVEHLILRSLRLYQAWKHVEIKSTI